MTETMQDYHRKRLEYMKAREQSASPLQAMTLDEYREQQLLTLLGDAHRMADASLSRGTFPIVAQVRENLDYRAYCLTGVTGSGKTYAGYALLSYFSGYKEGERLVTRRIHSVEALELEEAIHRNNYNYLDYLKTVDVLLIDDVGTEANRYKSEDFKAVLNSIFDYRYNHNDKITIITTNLSIEDLKASYERILSRIREIGVVLSAGETDYRKGKPNG